MRYCLQTLLFFGPPHFCPPIPAGSPNTCRLRSDKCFLLYLIKRLNQTTIRDHCCLFMTTSFNFLLIAQMLLSTLITKTGGGHIFYIRGFLPCAHRCLPSAPPLAIVNEISPIVRSPQKAPKQEDKLDHKTVPSPRACSLHDMATEGPSLPSRWYRPTIEQNEDRTTCFTFGFCSDLHVPHKCSARRPDLVAVKIQHILSRVEGPHAVKGRWNVYLRLLHCHQRMQRDATATPCRRSTTFISGRHEEKE